MRSAHGNAADAQSVESLMPAWLLATLAWFAALPRMVNDALDDAWAFGVRQADAFRNSLGGQVEVRAIGIVFTVVGVIIVMAVLSALAPDFFSNLGSFIENLTTVELGDSDAANLAETIIQVLAILVAIAGAMVLIGIALAAFRRGR